MTLPPANETITPHPEPYGIFGTQCQHKPGDVISDELGNWYKVTETSTYCAEIRLYNHTCGTGEACQFRRTMLEPMLAHTFIKPRALPTRKAR